MAQRGGGPKGGYSTYIGAAARPPRRKIAGYTTDQKNKAKGISIYLV